MKIIRIVSALALVIGHRAGRGTAEEPARPDCGHLAISSLPKSWRPMGKNLFLLERSPKGILIFTAGGQFAQIHVASDVPKIASNNRLTGTPEEYATIMRRSISLFGTYSVDEAKKTVTFNIVSSTYPNFAGEAQVSDYRQTDRRPIHQHESECGGRPRAATNIYKKAL